MEKRRKAVLIFFAASVIFAGSWNTLAYMQKEAQTVNRLEFAGEKGLDAVLTEPAWVPEKGILTIPGSRISKDPQVTNTSELDLDELVALRCEFVYGNACKDVKKRGTTLSTQDMKRVTDVYQIDYNSDTPGKKDWIRFEGQTSLDAIQCFYYKNVLKRNLPEAGETTEPLFTRIFVPEEVNEKKQEQIREMGGFEIRISGLVLQQMEQETSFGLATPGNAYEAGLFESMN